MKIDDFVSNVLAISSELVLSDSDLEHCLSELERCDKGDLFYRACYYVLTHLDEYALTNNLTEVS